MKAERFEDKKAAAQKNAAEEKKAGCPYKKKCGGCVYSGMEYPEQLKRKEQAVKKLLSGKGTVHPITGAEQPHYYRNKVTASFGFRNGKLIAGAYEKNSHRVVNIDHCLIQDERADRIIHVIRDLCVSFKIKAFDEDSGFGLLRHVMVRTAKKTGQVMVILVTASPVFPGSRNFVRVLREKCPEITTVIQNINSLRTSMVLGNREKVLFGKGFIEDELCGLRFRISSGSFYQVNPAQTEKIYEKAIGLASLTGKELVLDAYCGVGTIGMIAAKDAREVIGVELNPEAVKDAEANAKANGIRNISFYANDAGVFLEDLAEEGVQPDVVLMDPPRTGSTPEFIKSVCSAKPERVVYVSCNPETLARDVDIFRRYNFRMEEAWPFDNFPLTEHIETVALLKPL
ncbi:MAG: 23S rRNA (uracil(1939)-C(5))-methyltransferase RlmD [Stomatobaculum sp.]|nr:23S rRNA (uracil(1939)-C(5))-methyltransferase RlmD [Stomatobaculum sp.]